MILENQERSRLNVVVGKAWRSCSHVFMQAKFKSKTTQTTSKTRTLRLRLTISRGLTMNPVEGGEYPKDKHNVEHVVVREQSKQYHPFKRTDSHRKGGQ